MLTTKEIIYCLLNFEIQKDEDIELRGLNIIVTVDHGMSTVSTKYGSRLNKL